MPQDAEKDNFDDDAEVTPQAKPVPQAPAKSKFLSRLVKDAEALGFSDDEIEECGSNADLRLMIDNERDKIRHERSSQATPGSDRSDRVSGTPRDQAPTLPEPGANKPADDEEWEFDKEFESVVDPTIVSEVRKLGKAVKKAQKSGDSDAVKKLTEKIDGLNAKLERIENRSHPLVRRAHAHVAKYASLFGDSFDDDGIPTEADSRRRYKMMMDYIFNEPDEHGKNRATGNPEKDIDAAVRALFPGHELKGESAPAKGKPSNGTSRISQWAEAGQAPTTARNGADRSGVPGGTKGAVNKVAAKMREHGLDPGEIGDDDDDEI